MTHPEAGEAQRRAALEHFDPAYYLRTGPAIPADWPDPLDHFLIHGWREGRDPCRTFDVAYYLATNPDVVAAGINPLVHYVWAGRMEGRRPHPPLATERACLAASVAPSVRQRDWAAAADPSPAAPPEALDAALRASPGGRAGLVISIGHDDYLSTSGGIQNAIADEQALLAPAGWTYLHVSPAAPLPLLAEAVPAGCFRIRVRVDGGARFVTTFAVLLAAVAARAGRVELVVHHLMGHAPELVADLADAAGVRPMAWVHDYFTLCPSYALMRNDVRFCGAPPPGSPACTVCTFGTDRDLHLPRMQAFFARTRPSVLAPSGPALDIWRRHAGLPHSGAQVVPLGRLLLEHAADEVPPAWPRALRIAHLGARTMHKGWSVFEDLASLFGGDPRYAFYHLGQHDGGTDGGIRHVPVTVGPDDRHAMSEAVAAHGIDVVLCWPLWPETFCFVAHEAVAGGAFVVARAGAGNVWPAVAETGRACRLEDGAELQRYLASGELVRTVERSPRRWGAFMPSGGTATVLAARAAPVRRAELADA